MWGIRRRFRRLGIRNFVYRIVRLGMLILFCESVMEGGMGMGEVGDRAGGRDEEGEVGREG